MNTPADVLLVTVTKVETQAVLDVFSQHTGQKPRPEPRGDRTYHDLGVVNGVRVWLALSEMGAGGLGGALQAVTKAIEAIQPTAVIMVGIAFGVDDKKQQIGDILVSENLRLYELQRVGTVGRASSRAGQLQIILRGARPDSSRWLLNAFKNAALHWPKENAQVRFGCVLTGEKLVDNLDFRAQLRAFEPEAIGGEMEAGGLYAACQDKKVDWLLVKAICDWADGNKDVDKSARQLLAARNAAEFVLHTLKTISLRRPTGPAAEPPAPGQAIQTGSGALAQGERNVVAGERGLAIDGDFHGNVMIN